MKLLELPARKLLWLMSSDSDSLVISSIEIESIISVDSGRSGRKMRVMFVSAMCPVASEVLVTIPDDTICIYNNKSLCENFGNLRTNGYNYHKIL